MTIENLFEAKDESYQLYCTVYELSENAEQLLDIDKEHFGLVSHCRNFSEDTSWITDSYNDSRSYDGYLYSKIDPVPRKRMTHGDKREDVRMRIKERINASEVKPVEEIRLSIGKVYISEGNLILERGMKE
jgi:hypothetical protein